jgi:hypothetical protein
MVPKKMVDGVPVEIIAASTPPQLPTPIHFPIFTTSPTNSTTVPVLCFPHLVKGYHQVLVSPSDEPEQKLP